MDLARKREEAKRSGYSDAEISAHIKDHVIQQPPFKAKDCDAIPVSDLCIKGMLLAGFSEREVGAWIVENSGKTSREKCCAPVERRP